MIERTRVYLVCGDCRMGLEALGGVVDTSPRALTPGYGCETHPAHMRIMQAMHAVEATDVIRAQWLADNPAPSGPKVGGGGGDWTMVAQLAGLMIARGDAAVDEDAIVTAVDHARRIIAAAKEGDPWASTT